MSRKVAAVVGVGPGLGLAVARKFARVGYVVAILARDYEKLTKFAEQLAGEASAQVAAIRIDCSDAKSIREAFEAVNSLGPVEVLVYNTSGPFPWPPPKFTEITAEVFERSLTVSCVGAFHCVQQVVRGMIDRKCGTILFTGATGSIRGSAGFSQFAAGKFALRALGQSLARELQPQGIHVAHIIIDGVIRNKALGGTFAVEEKTLSPDAIAEAYWQLHIQDKSTWTQELDLRPFSEKF
ncbi:unnamed protein product [Calypogeia fissa]